MRNSGRFANRAVAGKLLAKHLERYRDRPEVLVLGLARGGVPVAAEVANLLHAPLDVMVVRKIGAPAHPEMAVGAVASGNITVLNNGLPSWLLDSDEMVRAVIHERAELKRREMLYRTGRTLSSLRGRIVILVDDGAATGASMRAAVQAVRKLNAAKVVIAVPVAALDACERLRYEADEVICPFTPAYFSSVGEWYVNFDQTTDEQVRSLLPPRPPHQDQSGEQPGAR